MVRMKQRYILCEIVSSRKKQFVLPFSDKEIYHCIKDAIVTSHGDYGIGMVQASLSEFPVEYLNPYTKIALIRARRGSYQMVLQAMTLIKKIISTDMFFRTIHIGGSIRSCQKFLTKYHYWKIPLLLRSCDSPDEQEEIKLSLKATELKLNS